MFLVIPRETPLLGLGRREDLGFETTARAVLRVGFEVFRRVPAVAFLRSLFLER